jgi:hypothetical protein
MPQACGRAVAGIGGGDLTRPGSEVAVRAPGGAASPRPVCAHGKSMRRTARRKTRTTPKDTCRPPRGRMPGQLTAWGQRNIIGRAMTYMNAQRLKISELSLAKQIIPLLYLLNGYREGGVKSDGASLPPGGCANAVQPPLFSFLLTPPLSSRVGAGKPSHCPEYSPGLSQAAPGPSAMCAPAIPGRYSNRSPAS